MQTQTPEPATMQGTNGMPAFDDALAASEDLLIEFFDFFDHTIGDVYAYIKHLTRAPEIAEDITLKLYFSLLQRRRFFWWRKQADKSQIFTMADKAIGNAIKWQEAASGDAYLREISRTMPGGTEEEKMDAGREFLHVFRNLSLKEQKMAIILFFLRWPKKRVCKVFDAEWNAVEGAHKSLLSQFEGVSGEKILDNIHCVPISEAKKAEMRIAILNKFRTAQLSSLRYVMPVASILLLVTTFVSGVGYLAVDPVSSGAQVRKMAAAETLLLQTQKDTLNILAHAEQKSRGVAQTYARQEMANIALDLAGPAIDAQIELEYEVYTTLKNMSARAAVSAIFRSLVSLLQ